jgi:hypothetical protein
VLKSPRGDGEKQLLSGTPHSVLNAGWDEGFVKTALKGNFFIYARGS